MHGYVVVDIGCLECGESSRLVGIFPDREAAVAAGATLVVDGYDEAVAATWSGTGVIAAFKIEGDW